MQSVSDSKREEEDGEMVLVSSSGDGKGILSSSEGSVSSSSKSSNSSSLPHIIGSSALLSSIFITSLVSNLCLLFAILFLIVYTKLL